MSQRIAMLLLCGLGLVAYASAKSVSGPVTVVPSKGGDWPKAMAPYGMNCPADSFVTGFTVTTDSSVPMDDDGEKNDILVASLWPLKCSNGKTVGSSDKLQKLPKSRKYNSRRSTGYSGVTLYTGELVDAVSLQPVGTKYGGSGGGDTHVLSCPAGQVITGIHGYATETHVVTVGLSCRSLK